MKKIKIVIMILSLSVMYQFAAALTSCSGNKVLMSKGSKGCGCHCQKKCVAPSDTLTYKNNGWRFGDCWGSCCWIRNGEQPVATETSLTEIYPNPASGIVTITFTLAQPGEVSLEVFDLTGRYVTTISRTVFEDETSEVTWDASGVNSGIYFLQMKAGSFSETKRLSVVK